MRLANRILGGLAALTLAAGLWGCKNPLDPIERSEEIKGLTYVDFSLTWDRWDADPEYDGVVLSLSYYNEFGDSLEFNGKPHTIVIEFWTQRDEGPEESSYKTFNKLFFSRTMRFENSDDDIRIPIEAYLSSMQAANLDLKDNVSIYVILRVFPPLEQPREELIVGYPDMLIYTPVTDGTTPNG